MNLGDLLAELRENILNDRTDRVSGTSDYLWTDATLTRYINEAQRRFAVRGLVLRDGSTPEATQVTMVANQGQYVLHPSVIAVVSAQISGRVVDLPRVGHSFLNMYRQPEEQWYDAGYLSALPPGEIRCYGTDEEVTADDSGSLSVVNMRVYPVPDTTFAGSTVQLRVIRKPMDPLSSPSDVPEIPEDHLLNMLDWAAFLALRMVDNDDVTNMARAADFSNRFEAHVQEARNEVMRRLYAPQPWGFGRGGFSWGH